MTTSVKRSRHAEIAGAGFAGLVTAIALSQRGWTVRVHERAPSLRSEGYGITIFPNGERVLRAIGVDQRFRSEAYPVFRHEMRDEHNRVISAPKQDHAFRRIMRSSLLKILADRAEELGVELHYGSSIVSASAGGVLIRSDGRHFPADLVIGADGIFSKVRDSLPIKQKQRMLPDGCWRVVIPRSADADDYILENGHIEWWSGRRRCLFGPKDAKEAYFTLVCPFDDERGKAIPIDVESWSEAFPPLAPLFAHARNVADWDTTMWVRFQLLHLSRWSEGRVALVGDSAHAMPPNLGQGGLTAMMNGLALAVALEDTPVEEALAKWEARERPLTEHTQRWALRHSRLSLLPPFLRSRAIEMTSRIPYLRRRYLRTAHHVPTGTGHLALEASS